MMSTCVYVNEDFEKRLKDTMRRDLLNNVLRLWAGIFLLNI